MRKDETLAERQQRLLVEGRGRQMLADLYRKQAAERRAARRVDALIASGLQPPEGYDAEAHPRADSPD